METRSPKDTGIGQPGSCNTVRPGRGRLSTWRIEEAGERAAFLSLSSAHSQESLQLSTLLPSQRAEDPSSTVKS